MRFHPSVWHRDSNTIAAGKSVRSLYLQVAQMPLVTSDPVDAAWLRCAL
ncbi:hypothetical protein AB0L34_12390 [Micromonospora sp. NPDC052213]